jgi:WD40 repeat protein/serine/threonine protein kinase
MTQVNRSTISQSPHERITIVLHEFERKWRSGQRPALLKHVPVPGQEGRREGIIELVHLDLTYRLRSGDEVPLVELYLSAFPAELSDPQTQVELIVTEYQECWRRGERIPRAAYRERFPSLAAALDESLTLAWTCTRCGRQAECNDAAAQDPICPHCGQSHSARKGEPRADSKTPPNVPHVPGYEILEECGRGGMGVVFKARQTNLRRLVALKMILSGIYASTHELERFRSEGEAVARLVHPNIVQIHDVGEHEGRPYLALEFVDGSRLDRKLKGITQPPSDAAALVETLARAVHYAHQQGIIHRDLKPANVLMTSDDVPKITDFGLAKKLDEHSLTFTGQVLGTPSYMAPEQAGSESGKGTDGATRKVAIGPAADVYALGAILYECLTGGPPFRGTSVVETLEQVRSVEPTGIRVQNPAVARDLETICLKCLEKEPNRRYVTAQDLADDLRRFQNDQPILARRVSSLERLWRWRRRNPLIAGLLGGVAALLVLTALTASVAALEFRSKAEVETQARREIEKQLYASSIAVAERELTLNNDVALASKLLESDKCPPHLRGWEWNYLMRLREHRREPLKGHKGGLWMAEFSPDGKRIATASIDGSVRLWDADTGKEVDAYWGHQILPQIQLPFVKTPPPLPIMCLAYSPDGRWIASGGLLPNPLEPTNIRKAFGVVKVWDGHSKKEIKTFAKHLGYVYCLTFSPDGKHIASATTNDDKSFAIWEAETGKELHVFRNNQSHIHRLRYTPDGRWLLAAHTDGNITVWDARTFELVRSIDAHPAPVYDLAFPADGSRFASAGLDGMVRIWRTEDGTLIKTLAGHSGSALGVAFSPDGKLIASSGYDKTVRIWDADSGEERITLRGHDDMVCSVAFSPDGKRLVSAAFDREARVWDASPIDEPVGPGLFALGDHSPGRHTDRVNSAAFSPAGGFLASAGWDTSVRLWDAQAGNPLRVLEGHKRVVWQVAVSPDGKRVASASWDRTVKVWDSATGQHLLTFDGHTTPVNSVAFNHDGTRLVSGSFEGLVKIWDAATGKETALCAGHVFPVMAVAFSADGERIASGSGDRTVKVWNARTGKLQLTLEGHQAMVHSVAFSPKGDRIATASWDRTARVWDSKTGKELLKEKLTLHTDRVQSVTFSPDGTRIATASDDKTIRLWSTATGASLATYRHPGVVWSASFSPDGNRVAGASWSASAWLKTWDARLKEEVEFNPQRHAK